MERNLRKERIGVVVSNKMDKSIVVAVKRKVKTPYLRQVREQDDQVHRSGRYQYVQRGRYRPYHGDPSAEQDETLEVG